MAVLAGLIVGLLVFGVGFLVGWVKGSVRTSNAMRAVYVLTPRRDVEAAQAAKTEEDKAWERAQDPLGHDPTMGWHCTTCGSLWHDTNEHEVMS